MLENIIVSVVTVVVFVVLLLVIQYLRNYRSVKKKQEYFKELHKGLKVGNKVSFSNGFYGEIKSINDKNETVDIKVKDGVITVSRYAIMEVLN